MNPLFAQRFAVAPVDGDGAPDVVYDEERGLTLTRDGQVFVEAGSRHAGPTLVTKTSVGDERPDEHCGDGSTVTLTHVRGEREDPDPKEFPYASLATDTRRTPSEAPDAPSSPMEMETVTKVREERDEHMVALAYASTHTKAGAEDPDISIEPIGLNTAYAHEERPPAVLLGDGTHTLVRAEGEDITHDLGGPPEPN